MILAVCAIYLVIGFIFSFIVAMIFEKSELPMLTWQKELAILLLHTLFWPVWIIMLIYFRLAKHVD